MSTVLTFCVKAWSDCVSFGDFEAYRDRFETIQGYFAPRFPEAVRLGSEMIKTIVEKTTTPMPVAARSVSNRIETYPLQC